MGENRAGWDSAITTLEDLYKDVERRSLSLPLFSIRPMGIYLWNSTKLILWSYLDLFLLLPMTALIFLRNLFPGRWSYRSFSGRYWKYTFTWLWSGEAPMAPFVVIRPLVTFMLVVHVYNRFRTIGRRIYLDESLLEEDRLHLQQKVADILKHWKRPTVLQGVYTYVLPLSGLLIGAYKSLFPNKLPLWVGFLVLFSLSYAILFVMSAFECKRSLMLGASGRAVYFPGAIPGNQCYEKERQILGSLGVKKREWPFDIALFFVSIAIGSWSFGTSLKFYESIGMPMPSPELIFVQMLVSYLPLVILLFLALYRRKVTGRS